MTSEELVQRKKDFKRTIDIRIQVFSDGHLEIDAPPDLHLFREVLYNAEQIMRDSYPGQAKALEDAARLIRSAGDEKRIILSGGIH